MQIFAVTTRFLQVHGASLSIKCLSSEVTRTVLPRSGHEGCCRPHRRMKLSSVFVATSLGHTGPILGNFKNRIPMKGMRTRCMMETLELGLMTCQILSEPASKTGLRTGRALTAAASKLDFQANQHVDDCKLTEKYGLVACAVLLQARPPGLCF